MPLTDTILPEYDHEMGTTRKLLERLPDTDLGWKPHEKSMSMGALGTHLATIPGWVGDILETEAFDLATAKGPRPPLDSRTAIVDAFDRAVTGTRRAIAAKTDAELLSPWTLKKGSRQVFTMPKVAVLRTLLLNHVIHHRGQLSVYLRLANRPVPSIYGPSADEPM